MMNALIGSYIRFYLISRIGKNQSRPGIYTKNENAGMFLSWQTYETILITTHSSIELVKFFLQNNVKYVLTERFCQDPSENYFSRQRSMGRRRGSRKKIGVRGGGGGIYVQASNTKFGSILWLKAFF